jgi:hypothetical protein
MLIFVVSGNKIDIIIEFLDITHSPVFFYLKHTTFQRMDSVSVLRQKSTEFDPLDRSGPYLPKRTVRITLPLAVYRQSVRPCDKPLETHDQYIIFQLNHCIYGMHIEYWWESQKERDHWKSKAYVGGQY